MEVTRIRALRGPNLWSRHTSIEAVVACHGDENTVGRLDGFERRLRALFPTIGELHPTVLGQPLSLAHVLENAALALQSQSGSAVMFGNTTRTLEDGVYQVVVQYAEEAVGRRAVALAAELIAAALREDGQFDTRAALAELRDLDESERLAQAAVDTHRHIAVDGGATYDARGIAVVVDRNMLGGAVIPDHHITFLPAPAHGVVDMGNAVMEQANQLLGIVAAHTLNIFDKVAQQQTSFARFRVNANQRMFSFINFGSELFAIALETGLIGTARRRIVINIGVQGAQVVRKLL